jgi:hypothetical protein
MEVEVVEAEPLEVVVDLALVVLVEEFVQQY